MRTNKDSLEGEGLNELAERFARDETRCCRQDGVPSSICPLVASIKMSGRRQRTRRERWAPSVAYVGYELQLRGRHRVQFQGGHVLQHRGGLQRTWLRNRGKKTIRSRFLYLFLKLHHVHGAMSYNRLQILITGPVVTGLCRISKQKKKVEVIVSVPRIILWKHRQANTMEGAAYTIKCLYWATRKEYRRIVICANIGISWPSN